MVLEQGEGPERALLESASYKTVSFSVCCERVRQRGNDAVGVHAFPHGWRTMNMLSLGPSLFHLFYF